MCDSFEHFEVQSIKSQCVCECGGECWARVCVGGECGGRLEKAAGAKVDQLLQEMPKPHESHDALES